MVLSLPPQSCSPESGLSKSGLSKSGLSKSGRPKAWHAILALPLILLLGACSHGGGFASPTLALRLLFEEGSPALQETVGQEIDSLATSVANDEDRYVVLASFAGDPSDNAEQMLALSLVRVLAVRDRLMTAGVSTKRIIVRACGVRQTEEPRERVDVFLAEPTERSPSFCGPKPDVPLPLGPDEDNETLSIQPTTVSSLPRPAGLPRFGLLTHCERRGHKPADR